MGKHAQSCFLLPLTNSGISPPSDS